MINKCYKYLNITWKNCMVKNDNCNGCVSINFNDNYVGYNCWLGINNKKVIGDENGNIKIIACNVEEEKKHLKLKIDINHIKKNIKEYQNQMDIHVYVQI